KFNPPPLNANDIEISDESVTISIVADRINSVLIQSGYKKVSGAKINDWLVSEGYMKKITENGNNFKIPTELGTELGITSEQREISGEPTRVNFYAMSVQKLIIGRITDVLNFEK
ncbi:MAG: hypothetical protein ACRCZK_02135, partial [Oscillospiraceae bacterium]